MREWPVDLVAEWLAGCAAALKLAEASRRQRQKVARARTAQQRRERRLRTARVMAMADAGHSSAEIATATGATVAEVDEITRSATSRPGPNGQDDLADVGEMVDALRRARRAVPADQPLTIERYSRWRDTEEPDAPPASRIMRRFSQLAPDQPRWRGSWARALRRAGVDDSLDVPVRRRWSDAELLDALARSGCRTIPAYDAWADAQVTRQPHSTTITKRFGGWPNALARVGRRTDTAANSAASSRI